MTQITNRRNFSCRAFFSQELFACFAARLAVILEAQSPSLPNPSLPNMKSHPFTRSLKASLCVAALALPGCITYDAYHTQPPVHRHSPAVVPAHARRPEPRRDAHQDRHDRHDRHDRNKDRRDDHRNHDENGERGAWNKRPSVGMTKADVLKRYGKPANVERTPKGEVWHYKAEVHGRDFIPIYGAVTQRRNGGSIGFDPHGRVSAYQWGRDYRNAWWH